MQHHDPGFLPFIGACLSGAFVGALRMKDGSVVERITTGIIGFLMAFHFGPIVADLFSLEGEYLASAGFVVGMIGKELATVIIDTAREYGPEAVRKFLNRGKPL